MIRTSFTENLNSLGCPLMLLEDWVDLNKLTVQYLEQYYEDQLNNKNISPILNINYWLNEFNNRQVEVNHYHKI